MPNRIALSNTGQIRYFMSPAEAEQMAPILAEQIATSPAMAMHDAREAAEAAETGKPTPQQIHMAAMRAAKELKRKTLEAAAA